jgi:hypothetical protein
MKKAENLKPEMLKMFMTKAANNLRRRHNLIFRFFPAFQRFSVSAF